MNAQELSQIHQRFFKSLLYTPKYESTNERTIEKKRSLRHRKGVLLWNKGTFRGNLKRTFGF